jgi:hypothetical protein
MAIQMCIAMRLGVINDSQVTNRKQGGLFVTLWEPPIPRCTPIGRFGVIYDSQPAEIYKSNITNRWKLLLFLK